MPCFLQKTFVSYKIDLRCKKKTSVVVKITLGHEIVKHAKNEITIYTFSSDSFPFAERIDKHEEKLNPQ